MKPNVSGFFLIAVLELSLFAGITKITQVFAQDTGKSTNTDANRNNLTTDPKDFQSMINTMKQYHGNNWVQGCTAMMTGVNKGS